MSKKKYQTVFALLLALVLVMLIWRAVPVLRNLGIIEDVMISFPSQEANAQTRSIVPSTPPTINIVFPQDGQGNAVAVEQSHGVNVSAWYLEAVNCNPPEPALSLYYLGQRLYMAKNNEPLETVNVKPYLALKNLKGKSFPAIMFDNIPVNLSKDPSGKYSLVLASHDSVGNGSVWIHGIDSRTISPQPIVPLGITKVDPKSGPWDLDSRIQIVFPHDERGNYASPESATFVNVAVDLFKHGTLESVPLDYPNAALQNYVREPYLLIAEGNQPFSEGKNNKRWLPQKTTYTINSKTYPRWVFNDIPVKPGTIYHFMVLVGRGSRPPWVTTFPTVWTHATDARTILPEPQVPPACVP